MRRRQFPVAGIKVARRRNHFPTPIERTDQWLKEKASAASGLRKPASTSSGDLMARRRKWKRDAKGRFAKTGRAATKLIRSNSRVGRVGPGGQYVGVKISGHRTIRRRVAVYGSASVGVRLAS